MRVDETYIKVKGKWGYLYRALDKAGNTIDFYISLKREATDKSFLCKSLKSIPGYSRPKSYNPTYGKTIRELKAEGQYAPDLEDR